MGIQNHSYMFLSELVNRRTPLGVEEADGAGLRLGAALLHGRAVRLQVVGAVLLGAASHAGQVRPEGHVDARQQEVQRLAGPRVDRSLRLGLGRVAHVVQPHRQAAVHKAGLLKRCASLAPFTQSRFMCVLPCLGHF